MNSRGDVATSALVGQNGLIALSSPQRPSQHDADLRISRTVFPALSAAPLTSIGMPRSTFYAWYSRYQDRQIADTGAAFDAVNARI
jgi:hypothetical protein